MTWEELIKELEKKAAVARERAAQVGYKHGAIKAQLNVEASIYAACAKLIKETHDEHRRAGTPDV